MKTRFQAVDYKLDSPKAILRFVRESDSSYYLRLETRQTQLQQQTPLAIEVIDTAGGATWLLGAYTTVTPRNGGIVAEGELRSTHGTRFRFSDSYVRDGDGFRLQRRVTIASPNPQDVGFSTRFGLAWTTPRTTRDCDVLMPGAWYRQNQNVPPGAFAVHIDDQRLLYRTDRLGLPLIMVRELASGTTLVLQEIGGTSTTIAVEEVRDRITDERVQVSAMGLLNTGHLEAVFTFPGTEEERAQGKSSVRRFAPRSHPVKVGVAHSYTLYFEMTPMVDYAAAIERTTKAAIQRAAPPLLKADLNRVYQASMELLDTVIQPYNGTVSVPFQVGVPGGEIKDTSMQMGFVGMAIPSAAMLLRYGLETKNQSAIQRATQVVDFWVQHSPEPSGVPKNWADFPAQGKFTWRPYPTHLRVASDGMRGALRAWDTAQRHGIPKPEWLQYARGFGDFLVMHQNTDGAWFGTWNFNGTPNGRYTNASVHPLSFLIDLWRATGEAKYQQAALRAGEFCLKTVHAPYSYVGGTPDNPNVTDKEAGIMAVQGFLALYDATGEARWLAAARQAALFCETWVYWRNLPMPPGNTKQVFPNGRSTVGMSLISTGHSGVDNFMAVAPFDWYRLYLATGDRHFRDTARLLLHDTKQIIDWDGKLKYKYPGLMPEALTLSIGRGHGVAGWLPWLTFVVAEPLIRLQETFGSMSLDQIEKMPLKTQREKSAQFGKTRGFQVAR
ncbi:MAG: hypothetical protein QM758_07840 [Armatimonas sp.]